MTFPPITVLQSSTGEAGRGGDGKQGISGTCDCWTHLGTFKVISVTLASLHRGQREKERKKERLGCIMCEDKDMLEMSNLIWG
jgi:hypothetical protein